MPKYMGLTASRIRACVGGVLIIRMNAHVGSILVFLKRGCLLHVGCGRHSFGSVGCWAYLVSRFS